jgi:hypothetical protein
MWWPDLLKTFNIKKLTKIRKSTVRQQAAAAKPPGHATGHQEPAAARQPSPAAAKQPEPAAAGQPSPAAVKQPEPAAAPKREEKGKGPLNKTPRNPVEKERKRRRISE